MTRAPLGELDGFVAMPEFKAMMASLKANPEWVNRRQAESQMQTQQTIAGIHQQQQFSQQMINQSNAAFQQQMAANQRFYDTLADNNRQFNANMQARTNQSIAQAQDQQARMDAEAHQWTLYAGDKREYTNPYNGQTVVASNRYTQQWVSSDGQYVVGSNSGANPNDYVAPGGPSFSLMTPH